MLGIHLHVRRFGPQRNKVGRGNGQMKNPKSVPAHLVEPSAERLFEGPFAEWRRRGGRDRVGDPLAHGRRLVAHARSVFRCGLGPSARLSQRGGSRKPMLGSWCALGRTTRVGSGPEGSQTTPSVERALEAHTGTVSSHASSSSRSSSANRAV